MKTLRHYRTVRLSETPTHEEDFAELVLAAGQGDLRAVEALADAYYPALLAEAAEVLGPYQQADAEDAVQEFLASLCEGRNRFLPRRERATTWMVRIVRAIALRRRHMGERYEY